MDAAANNVSIGVGRLGDGWRKRDDGWLVRNGEGRRGGGEEEGEILTRAGAIVCRTTNLQPRYRFASRSRVSPE